MKSDLFIFRMAAASSKALMCLNISSLLCTARSFGVEGERVWSASRMHAIETWQWHCLLQQNDTQHTHYKDGSELLYNNILCLLLKHISINIVAAAVAAAAAASLPPASSTLPKITIVTICNAIYSIRNLCWLTFDSKLETCNFAQHCATCHMPRLCDSRFLAKKQ